MSKMTVTASRKVQAPANIVYNILADYGHHKKILPPRFFTGLDVIKGGVGAGTEFVLHARALGSNTQMHMAVTEPEPGSVLMERDIKTDLKTIFTVDPINQMTSLVTIETIWLPKPGLRGWLDRLFTPPLMQMVYRQELEILNQYAKKPIHNRPRLAL